MAFFHSGESSRVERTIGHTHALGLSCEEHAGKIVSLMSEYCLCQRVKPPSDPKSPFTSDADYIAALQVPCHALPYLEKMLLGFVRRITP